MRFRLFLIGIFVVGATATAAAQERYDSDFLANQLFREGLRMQRSLRQPQVPPPDFSQFGTPAPGYQSRPAPQSHGCVVFGDGLGGGIVDCD